MSRTIGRHRPRSSPRGDTVAMCAYCGIVWLRSRLTMDGAGMLVCPDEGNGRDEVTLARLIAQDSARPKRVVIRILGGADDHTDDPPPTGNPTPYNPRLP